MKRYTIHLRTTEPTPDTGSIKAAIEGSFLKSACLIKLHSISYEDEIIIIEVESEAKRSMLVQELNSLTKNWHVQVTTVNWGWLLPQSQPDQPTPDPYKSQASQSNPIQDYSYGVRHLAGIVVGIGIVGVIGILLLLRIPSFGLLFLLVGVYLVAIQLRSIRCGASNIEFRYVMGGLERFDWEDIIGLQIKDARGQWAYLDTKRGERVFQIGEFFGVVEAATLIKTIIERASLVFVEMPSQGNAVYKRPNSEQ